MAIEKLVLLVFVRKVFALYIIYILLYGILHFIVHVKVPAKKAGLKFFGDAEHIVADQYLSIGTATGTNAYGGYE